MCCLKHVESQTDAASPVKQGGCTIVMISWWNAPLGYSTLRQPPLQASAARRDQRESKNKGNCSIHLAKIQPL
jgi:hypothetical protein